MPKKPKSFSVYFGSELYSLKHLLGNAYIAEAIYEKSHGRYLCQLPQDSTNGVRPHTTRDHDICLLMSCDVALFTFDGAEIESATAVEFLLAKVADIPAVVLRSDLRAGGDGPSPWSLMASYYPRTVSIVLDGLGAYRAAMRRRLRPGKLDEVMHLAGQHSSAGAQRMCDDVAGACVRAFDRVRAMEPVMPKYLREPVYNWLPLMPGLRGNRKELRKLFERFLERKVEKDLL